MLALAGAIIDVLGEGFGSGLAESIWEGTMKIVYKSTETAVASEAKKEE